jgi:hypothetical protein
MISLDYLFRETNEQSPTTTENDTPKLTLEALKKLSRKFNIDLIPKVCINKIIF